MLPRPVVTAIVCLLTLGELVNIAGQVFLGSGDTAIHVMYPAVLGALGIASAKKTGPDKAPDDPPKPPPELPPAALDAETEQLSRHRRRDPR